MNAQWAIPERNELLRRYPGSTKRPDQIGKIARSQRGGRQVAGSCRASAGWRRRVTKAIACSWATWSGSVAPAVIRNTNRRRIVVDSRHPGAPVSGGVLQIREVR